MTRHGVVSHSSKGAAPAFQLTVLRSQMAHSGMPLTQNAMK